MIDFERWEEIGDDEVFDSPVFPLVRILGVYSEELGVDGDATIYLCFIHGFIKLGGMVVHILYLHQQLEGVLRHAIMSCEDQVVLRSRLSIQFPEKKTTFEWMKFKK